MLAVQIIINHVLTRPDAHRGAEESHIQQPRLAVLLIVYLSPARNERTVERAFDVPPLHGMSAVVHPYSVSVEHPVDLEPGKPGEFGLAQVLRFDLLVAQFADALRIIIAPALIYFKAVPGIEHSPGVDGDGILEFLRLVESPLLLVLLIEKDFVSKSELDRSDEPAADIMPCIKLSPARKNAPEQRRRQGLMRRGDVPFVSGKRIDGFYARLALDDHRIAEALAAEGEDEKDAEGQPAEIGHRAQK